MAFKIARVQDHSHRASALARHLPSTQAGAVKWGVFTELKSDNQLDYVPTRTWVGNQIYLLSVLPAHNLGRELQMIAHPPSRIMLEKQPAL